MSQSLSKVLLHIIFSTKNRSPLIDQSWRADLFAYLSGIARQMDCECFRVGGVDDHVHLAVTLPRTVTQAQLVEELKTVSSRWSKQWSPDFAWQRGYGIFSVSCRNLQALCDYIDQQEQHHRAVTFQEEYRQFLQRHGLTYDERYMWD